MSEKVIDLTNIQFRWQGENRNLLDIPSLEVFKGGHVFLQGPSGTGKSTLLNLLAGIHKPNAGEMIILGQKPGNFNIIKRDQFRADHLGVIFQQFNLLPYLNVIENVSLACRFSKIRKEKAGYPEQSAKKLLEDLGISERLFYKSASALSVGQQQRVAAARALIGRPEIILADEPTSALDVQNRDRFLELLFQEADIQGSTLVYVSHDPSLSSRFKRTISLSEINKAKGEEE